MLRLAGSLITNQIRAYDLLHERGRVADTTARGVSWLHIDGGY
jgi:hypothetical protein